MILTLLRSLRRPARRTAPLPDTLPQADQRVWRVIAERTDLAYLDLVPASVIEPRELDVTERAAGARAATHLWAGRFLLNRYRDQYVRAGVTLLERLRRHREMEGYLSAFAEALAYARAQAEGERSAPWPPRLFQTGGQLPLLQRYRRDRHAYTAVV
ncbi:hypothetical protein OG440_40115 (plasmid) [Streptomyces sp. NBC_00637]|uniref:hypothetical protein n=1 Tax=Streptomyces sp. NBC_00637 TaxID=2903667 RepID=UPI002F90828B